MSKLYCVFCGVLCAWMLSGCRQPASIVERKESVQAKQLLQGIWIDEESETVVSTIPTQPLCLHILKW